MRKAWIFDMDGTLTDSMGIWEQAPLVLLREYGKAPRPDLRAKLLPLGLAESARLMIAEYDLALDEDAFIEKTNAIVRGLYKTVSLKPGAKALLETLHARGAKMCIASNTAQPLCEEVLTRLGVRPYFEFILSARDGFCKDAPPIYLESMRRLGGRDPGQCVVCEDALHAARTAAGAGFYVVGIADPHSRMHEPQLRALCRQFIPGWDALDLDAL